MKVKVLKKTRQFEVVNATNLGIQAYTDGNDYPQEVIEIVAASGTGASCVNVYGKFISGRGFSDKKNYSKVVNRKGQTLDLILDLISKDYALIGGYAIHVNYNANFRITTIQHVPIETIRFEKLDDDGNFSKVALHPDWGKRYTKLRKWRKEDIVFIDLFNPDPEIIRQQVEFAGGWNKYKGQILYFSNEGDKVYPVPIFSGAITDMNTEEGISNVSNRNVRNNFFTAGAIVDYNNTDESEEQENITEKSLLSFQGDENLGKWMYMQVKSKEEKPDFIELSGKNYDKEFDVTRKAVKESIGESFNQPPILRAQNVGANFGADLMKNAYDYYNSVTENERMNIERVLTTIFQNWFEPIGLNFEIMPLSYNARSNDISQIPKEVLSTLTANEKRELIGYNEIQDSEGDVYTLAEKIGVGGTTALTQIISDTALNDNQKKGLLKVLFSLTDSDIDLIFTA